MTYPSRGLRWLAGRAVAIGVGLLLLLLAAGNAHAQTCTAPTTSGEQGWLDVTWTGPGCTGTGNSGQPVPGAGSDVVIPSGSTIRCGTAPTLTTLTVASGGTLNMGSGVAAGTLVIKGDLTNNGTIQNRPATTWVNSITVGGRWTNNGTFTPGTGAPQIDVILNGSSGTTIGGSSATTFNNLTLSGSGTTALGANVTTTGTLTLTSGTLNVATSTLTANSTVTCGGSTIADSSATGTFTYGTGTQSVCAGNYGILTFVSGAKTLPTTGTVAIAGAFNLGTATATMTNSTVSFNGAGNQAIPTIAYNNLTIAGSGTKTLAATQAVTGALTLTSGTLAVTGTNTLTASGAVTCGGGAISSAAGGTVSYQTTTGQTVCPGSYGNLTLSSTARTLSSTGTIAIAGTFTVGATVPTITGGTVSFTGAGAQSIPVLAYNNLDISSTNTATLANNTTVAGTLSLTSGTLAVAARTLTASGPLTLTGGTLSLTTGSVTANSTVTCGAGTITDSAAGTVSYQGPAAQNVCAGTYYNLTFNNQSKTLAPSGTIAIGNTFTPGAAGTLTVAGSTVNFNKAGAQAVPALTYNNLTISGSGNKTLAAGTTTAAGTLALTAGTLVVGANTLTAKGTVNCGLLTSAATGTVNYAAAGAQTVCPATYGILNTSGSGTKTLGGAVIAAGAVNVGAGTTLDQGSSTLTSAGLLTVASTGAFTNTGTGTLTLNGGLTNNGTFSVDGGGSGCRTTDTRATITSAAAHTWTGSGNFQLTDVTLTNQNSGVGTITAFHATGGSATITPVADCTGAPAFPTAVRLASFTATAHGSRVLLKWQTAMESNNIGFRLYREAADASSAVTPHLISGSALMVGLRATLSGGRSYVWWDDLPAGADARSTRYWLADVDLRGEQTFHGPVAPKLSYEPAPDLRNAPHLQQLAGSIGAAGGVSSPGSAVQGGPAGRIFRSLPPTTPNATAAQWTLASARSLKIGISHPGWYQVTSQDLRDHGLGNVEPTRLQLFADGQQIPMVARGPAHGRSVTPEGTVEFYATGLDSQWSSERTYWLAAGTSAGKRVAKVSATATDPAPASFAFTVESAPKVIYFSALVNGSGSKFFGPLVSTDAQTPTTLTLDVRNPDAAPAGQAALDVTVQGVMDGLHVVAVLLDGNPVGQVEFNGQELGTTHLLFDQSSLHEGSNQIALWAEGGQMDLSLVASVGLTYWRRYVADGDTLSMTAPADSHLVVGGFTSPRIHVMDVTDPENPYELIAAVQNDGSGYTVTTDVAGTGVRNLIAFTDEKVESPASLKANSPSSWHSAERAANLVVLTHTAVADALRPLVRLREGQGYIVALVDVEDVYDEFSFGNKTPQAIRDFLALATSTWRKRPGFLLLAGSASGDPRNFLGYGDFDLVPTKFVEATYNQAASDDWFVDFNDDGLPDMAIGRLPVRDSIQAAAVVQKLIGYSHTGGADWRKTAVLVSGPATEDFDFPAATNAVAAQIPASMFLTQIFRGDFADDTLAHAAVVGAFNQGALLVNYTGHSSETAWQGNLLTVDDVPLLTNGLRLPFVSSMTCWTGWFADPYGETLGEALLKAPQGGAIAVWASSGLTEPDGQLVLDREFMRLLFSARKPTIGEATARAKAAVTDLDIRRTWILLGDPTTRLE